MQDWLESGGNLRKTGRSNRADGRNGKVARGVGWRKVAEWVGRADSALRFREALAADAQAGGGWGGESHRHIAAVQWWLAPFFLSNAPGRLRKSSWVQQQPRLAWKSKGKSRAGMDSSQPSTQILKSLVGKERETRHSYLSFPRETKYISEPNSPEKKQRYGRQGKEDKCSFTRL